MARTIMSINEIGSQHFYGAVLYPNGTVLKSFNKRRLPHKKRTRYNTGVLFPFRYSTFKALPPKNWYF